MQKKEKSYRVLETGTGTTTVGKGKLSTCLPKKQAEEYRDSLLKQGLCAIVFAVDEQGRP